MKAAFLIFNLLLMILPISSKAAGPILVDSGGTGAAVVWQEGQVSYNPETTGDGGIGGDLGHLNNVEARQLVSDLFDEWSEVTLFDGDSAVSTAVLTVTEGFGLGNVGISEVDEHFTYCPSEELCAGLDPPFVIGSARSGQSPIIFDEQGDITDKVLGVGASESILGFAGPRVVSRESGTLHITESQAVLNGKFIDCPDGAGESDACQSPEVSLNAFKAVILHELGHFLGLDHAQVNLGQLNAALNGNSAAGDTIATMAPIFVGASQLSLHYDDKVAISSLYPSDSFTNNFCQLSGTVFFSDGDTPIQGVNVIARRQDNPLLEATSFVSGAFYTGARDCQREFGDFEIKGLQPGAVYSIEIEPINPSFQGGSSIEPCETPQQGFTAQAAVQVASCTAGGLVVHDFVTNKSLLADDSATSTAATGATSGGCQLTRARDLISPFFFKNIFLLCVGLLFFRVCRRKILSVKVMRETCCE